jgi:electron transfer flavoprotein beta subunit
MKILVCISQTPDTTAKIKFNAEQTQLDANGVQFIMNPYDEWYALVRAIELKEQLGGEVTVIHVGTVANDPTIRKALAIGADNAVRVDSEASSSLFTAKQIAAYAKGENFDIVFFGKETIDYNGSEVPAMVSELLDLPYISYGTEMTVAGNIATISRDIEGGKETVEVATPFVISAAKGMAEQRIPNMKGIMMSKTKPIKVVPATANSNTSNIVKYEYPAEKKGCKMISADNIDELVSLLHNEAKVI